MERNRIHVVVALFQHLPVPFEVGWHKGAARAARDQLDGRVHRAHLPGGVRRLQAVFTSGQMSDLPGAVHFISEAPEFDLVGLLKTVLAAQVAPARPFFQVAVFDQRGGVCGRARAEVRRKQRLGANQATPFDELVGPELIRLNRIPGPVEDPWPVFLRAHAVKPVVAGDEVPARVAHDGHAKLVDLFRDVLSKAVRVRPLRVGFINSVVDRAA
ncbi:MAG: hypothetical protein DMG23_15665 [Acidobacteria bacterium]|nr:MAG: hypothetical protein DMG23_15665 [Acidobacteriota bacterium]